MKKILIIYTSIGLGHKVVAENIAEALKKFPGVEILMLDILKFYSGKLTDWGEKVYLVLINHQPGLWRFFYRNKIFNKLTLPLRLPFAAIKANKLASYLKDSKPDLVLTTQTTATAVMSYLKQTGRFRKPLVTAFSDYHFQPYWAYPRVDRYLVVTEEQIEEMENWGIGKKQSLITGLSVHTSFFASFDRLTLLKELGLAGDKPIILVMGGGHGWGIKPDDIRELLASEYDMQIVVTTGTDQGLAEQLALLNQAGASSLKVFPNLSNKQVAKLFAVARVLVTKPGGLSIAQALVRNLPMILVNPLPGGEELNQEYLLKRGLAVAAQNSQEVRLGVERLLLDRKTYQELVGRMKRYAAPEAAGKAGRMIVDMLEGQY